MLQINAVIATAIAEAVSVKKVTGLEAKPATFSTPRVNVIIATAITDSAEATGLIIIFPVKENKRKEGYINDINNRNEAINPYTVA